MVCQGQHQIRAGFVWQLILDLQHLAGRKLNDFNRDVIQEGNVLAADVIERPVHLLEIRQLIWRRGKTDPLPESNQFPSVSILADCHIVIDFFKNNHG